MMKSGHETSKNKSREKNSAKNNNTRGSNKKQTIAHVSSKKPFKMPQRHIVD